ncbi:hypothetical protein CWO91_05230, partial [Bradyrhizobium genosp. SA-3]
MLFIISIVRASAQKAAWLKQRLRRRYKVGSWPEVEDHDGARHVSGRGQTGRGGDTAKSTRMTQSGHLRTLEVLL